MPKQTEFVETVLEKLAPLGEPGARFMFGGWGIYLDGIMCALVADDALFLKADAVSRITFEQADCQAFAPYEDKTKTMSYYEAPAEMFDEDERFLHWFRLAFDAALRSAKTKSKRAKEPKGQSK